MKKRQLLQAITAGSALIVSGVAFAAAPPTSPFGDTGFSIDTGNFAITGGNQLSADCPANSTCLVYPGGDGTDGLLQRQVTYTDPITLLSTTYIQAIVGETGVEDGADQFFANEQIVRMQVNGTNSSAGITNIAQKMVMTEDDPLVDGDTFSSTHTMLGSEYYNGGTGPDLLYALDQSVGLGGTAGAQQLTRIRGEITGGGGDLNGNGAAYKRVAIDQTGVGTPGGAMGDFVFRSQVHDGTAPTDLILPDGTGGDQTVSTGTTATRLQAMYISGPGINPFMYQRFAVGVATNGDLTGATVIEINNADPVVYAEIGTGPWNWGPGSDAETIFGAVDDVTTSALDLYPY